METPSGPATCELVFLITEDEELVSHIVQFSEDEEPVDLLSTTKLRAYPALGSFGTDVGRMARDLNALFKIANTINSIRDLELLQQRLLQLIGEVVPADYGAIAILRHADDEPSSSSTWHRQAGATMPTADPARHCAARLVGALGHPQSAHARVGRYRKRALCSFGRGGKNDRVIYVLATGSRTKFEEDHVHFLSSVAGIAAVTLENVLALEILRNENRRLQAELDLGGVLIGESKAMRQVQSFIAKVAKSDSTVWFGAKAVPVRNWWHGPSIATVRGAEKPFVAINCAAIPENLLESELFGHEKGSFTGAIALKKGRLEVAEGGTVFLDEVGELAPMLQAKLLRALQEHEFDRVGGTRPLKLNARVIAATNKNLEEAIKNSEFRQDLYYRLNVVSVVVPPLRDRPDDVSLLAIYFAAKYAEKCKRSLKGISADARALLMNYSWPGNVRELENAIEHAIVLGLGDEIVPDDLPEALLEVKPVGSSAKYHDKLNELKKQMIADAVKQTKGNYTEAAKALGVHPNYLHRLIRNLNIKGELKRDGGE